MEKRGKMESKVSKEEYAAIWFLAGIMTGLLIAIAVVANILP